jgi:hypothetical protein
MVAARNATLSGKRYWGLTLKARVAGSTVKIGKVGTPDAVDVSYSLDHGETWTPYVIDTVISLVNAGDSVCFAASEGVTNTSFGQHANKYYHNFAMTGVIAASGDISSLLRNDRATASTLSLGQGCYRGLFSGCGSLVAAPELPATKLDKSCYRAMFEYTGIEDPPNLPATTLKEQCYFYMFQGCTSLRSTANLGNVSLINGVSACYAMYIGCTSLLTVRDLPSATPTGSCYYQMFSGCTSLTTAPSLPATTLVGSCYRQMFEGCTSLTVAPSLPATTLPASCYMMMFKDCTALVTGPALGGTNASISVANPNSCDSMFYGCTALATMSSFTITAASGKQCCRFMFRDCSSLAMCPVSSVTATTLGQNGFEGMFQGCTKMTSGPSLSTITTLTAQQNCYSMYNGCKALAAAPALPSATTLTSGCYKAMFQGCTSLATGPTTLPATTLQSDCYYNMFYSCSSLENAPELPAPTLVSSCYYQMFYKCAKVDAITVGFSDSSKFGTNCVSNWVNGVKSTGTFTCPTALGTDETITRGASACPTDWTVVNV